jgi:AcrR family transcriptional regulator
VVAINNDVNNNVINMNVDSADTKKAKRIRRTPEEAKSLILKVAADRLAEFGLEGLNISGVSKAAGISHATVIHHFGSTAAMREALLHQMTRDLLSDVVEALNHQEPPEQILRRLFSTLSQDGHGKLLAWRAVEHQEINEGAESGHLFQSVIAALADQASGVDDARQIVYLVALAALGQSISGDIVQSLIGMTADETDRFPAWLAKTIGDI